MVHIVTLCLYLSTELLVCSFKVMFSEVYVEDVPQHETKPSLWTVAFLNPNRDYCVSFVQLSILCL